MVDVEFPKNLSSKFTKLAKTRFPVETFAIALGSATKRKITISDLWFPLDISDYSTPDYIRIPHHWEQQALDYARQKKLAILGDIHSHCYNSCQDCSPSEVDWDGGTDLIYLTASQNTIRGICTIYKTNKTKRARFRFWPVIKKLNTKII